ncbi:sensor histidine kinase [Nocardioides mangrovi]|uniref:histidine kinase n=1 Tax=Nocardioides mangrovi TaxID=2874580 RepID=A0ABS7U9E5_9ACTN|nr:HAMP domain-containing sensor histidine kinase [Nocardioides mangrovi]MBZ5737603.1 HAMP domain-containing histidine kinase [Nocardioides mangrovi]
MRHRFASLTSRLVLTTVALALVVSVLIGTITTFAVRDYLVNQLDENVHASVEGARNFGVSRPGPGIGGPGRDVGTIAAQWTSDGSSSIGQLRTQRADGMNDQTDLSDDEIETLQSLPTDGTVHTVDLGDDGSFRVAVAQSSVDSTIVAVGIGTSNVDDVVNTLIWWEVLLGLVAVLGAGGAATIVVRRQLRPLREVAATAHTVAELPLESGEIDIQARVPEHLTDERTEVGQVGAALNTLLAHVESSLSARHRSEQQVRQFVADASHELRSPLATIAGYTELARRRPGDTEIVGTALDKVEEESGRMTSLVEDLLLLARLDSGRPLEREPVDLTRLCVEAVSDARVVDPTHRWRVDVPDDLVDAPAEVAGDQLRLHQVLTNLLTNARKYTPEGSTITVTVRRDGFSVHDDGPGFPPELVGRAFERFVRGDAARTRGSELGVGGVGLGLSLVEAIVTAHGGRVTLRSRPGETVVDVSLPV